MKKEFGKWLMDVAKYVATVVIVSNFFSGLQENAILLVGGICVTVILVVGLLLTKEPKNKMKKRKK